MSIIKYNFGHPKIQDKLYLFFRGETFWMIEDDDDDDGDGHVRMIKGTLQTKILLIKLSKCIKVLLGKTIVK